MMREEWKVWGTAATQENAGNAGRNAVALSPILCFRPWLALGGKSFMNDAQTDTDLRGRTTRPSRGEWEGWALGSMAGVRSSSTTRAPSPLARRQSAWRRPPHAARPRAAGSGCGHEAAGDLSPSLRVGENTHKARFPKLGWNCKRYSNAKETLSKMTVGLMAAAQLFTPSNPMCWGNGGDPVVRTRQRRRGRR